jgi:peptide/nickel transport system permease protein
MVSPLTIIATIIVLGVIAAGILATVVEFMVPDIHNRPNLWRSLEPPSLEHPMGTDSLGRDILIRIIFGTKPVLLVIVVSVIVAATLGTIIGLTSGYFGGRVDLVMSRVIDALMSFPAILIALAIVAALGPGLWRIAIAIGIAEASVFARLSRGLMIVEKEQLYVQAGKAIGASSTRIIFRHILPNIAGPIIVQTTFTAASAILWEAALSFLGLGAQPPTPSWGLMLYEAKDYMRVAPHAIVFPGLAIFVTVLSFNIVGEALRDMLDPRFRKVMR